MPWPVFARNSTNRIPAQGDSTVVADAITDNWSSMSGGASIVPHSGQGFTQSHSCTGSVQSEILHYSTLVQRVEPSLLLIGHRDRSETTVKVPSSHVVFSIVTSRLTSPRLS